MHLDVLFESPPGMTASEAARRAGINRSTLHRIASGEVQPSLDTLRELAIIHGFDLQLNLVPLSDLDAAAAARALLDPAFDGVQLDDGAREWVERLSRIGDHPIAVLQAAGRASSVLHRPHAAMFRGDPSALRLASAGDASRGGWAVSGGAAIALAGTMDKPNPSILWVEDLDAAAAALQETHRRVKSAAGAQVIVAAAPDWLFVDGYRIDMVRFVAPIQMLLDCIGLGGSLEHAAIEIAKEW